MEKPPILGESFKEFQAQAREIPEVAEYLDRRLTMDQAIGYLIATIEAELSYLDAMDKAAIVMEMERQFLTMKPEEAGRIYLERWAKGWEDGKA